MKNSDSIKLAHIVLLSLFISLLFSFSCKNSDTQYDFYQIKIYHLNDKAQEAVMDKFLKEAFIPAVHRAGITKIGVFKPVEGDTIAGNVIIVFIPFKSLKQFEDLPLVLAKDSEYNASGKDYIDAPYNNPPYGRIESIILKAFVEMPQYAVPSYNSKPAERIYELRSYEGATEKIFQRKVEMFNKGGEVKLFQKLGFNAVFYAEVISGSTMPNLMYMTTFSDMKSHDEHWNAFRNAPEWKELSGREEYRNTVSRAVIYLLHPTDYSDI